MCQKKRESENREKKIEKEKEKETGGKRGLNVLFQKYTYTFYHSNRFSEKNLHALCIFDARIDGLY